MQNKIIELSKFKVQKGKEQLTKEWILYLEDHMSEVLLTLEDEKMFVESIFLEIVDDCMYLYWFTIQGTGATNVSDSNFEVDKKHCEYWMSCIDETYPPSKIKHCVSFIPEKVRKSF